MTRASRLLRRQAAPAVVLGLLLGGLAVPAPAQIATAPSTPVVGSSNTATADPPIPRPSTTPCAVQLFSHQTFADFSPKPFAYAPPAGCPGPWAKVVLEADFAVSAGRQFDRTAQIAIGHVNVYYGTTPEPSRTLGPTWHVERDLTDYGALLRSAQAGDANLGNLVNPTFTGIITGSAVLKFYPASARQPAPRAADAVLPLSSAPGGAALLASTASVLAPTFNLPPNVEGAYLDLVTQSQSADEFWYTCVPDDVAGQLFSCGGTAFREAEVTVDGQPAGVAPVYPWIYTGGIDPFLWRPIPGVQTLDFLPYRVDLTPFAGVLSNGQPHQVGIRVFNANNYFLVAASLLLYLDHGASQVTGAVTQNTLAAAPQPVVHEDLATAADGTVTGTVTTESERRFTLAGYVRTSHGRVETTVRQAIDFSNRQQFVVSATQFVQDITQGTKISSATETRGGGATALAAKQLSYPLTLDISAVANADGSSAQTTTVDQRFESVDAGVGRGLPSFGTVSNAMATADTLLFDAAGNLTGTQNQKSSQTYRAASIGGCYSRSIAAVNGALTSVVDGQGCGDGDR
jgi:hypothetical protein